jgi:hypothetical protein
MGGTEIAEAFAAATGLLFLGVWLARIGELIICGFDEALKAELPPGEDGPFPSYLTDDVERLREGGAL